MESVCWFCEMSNDSLIRDDDVGDGVDGDDDFQGVNGDSEKGDDNGGYGDCDVANGDGEKLKINKLMEDHFQLTISELFEPQTFPIFSSLFSRCSAMWSNMT